MQFKYNPYLKKLLNKWPGKKYFGIYRFLPVFFILGAALEYFMINWNIRETNFYRTYKKREAISIVNQENLRSK